MQSVPVVPREIPWQTVQIIEEEDDQLHEDDDDDDAKQEMLMESDPMTRYKSFGFLVVFVTWGFVENVGNAEDVRFLVKMLKI